MGGFTSREFIFPKGDLEQLFQEGRSSIEVHAIFDRRMVGGQPATDEQLKAYIQYVLLLDPASPEFKAAFDRIKREEIGEAPVGDKHIEPESGTELEDKKVYGINCLRRDDKGVYILNHMLHACIKQTASRLGMLFVKKEQLGAKGDITEMGKVEAVGSSLLSKDEPWKIYPYCTTGVRTVFETLRGSVNTAKGRTSIMYDAEMMEAGCEFNFKFSWVAGRLTCADLLKVAVNIGNVGLGSGRSLGYGRFHITDDVKCKESTKERGAEAETKQKKGKKAEVEPAPAAK